MTYGLNPNFPVEAHMIERIMPIIFEANYKVNSWMNQESDFDQKLLEQMDKVKSYDNRREKKVKNKLLGIMRQTK